MAGIRLFNVHYLWEDCVSMGLGILIALFRNKETVLADEVDLLKW